MNHILTVDPGVYTMGACLWDETEWFAKHLALPMKRIDLDIPSKDRKQLSANGAMNYLIKYLSKWFVNYCITECYCEKPQTFMSAKGMASSIKGHVLNMEMFRGMLFGLCQQYDCVFHDVGVLQWKGQLPKSLTIERIKEIYIDAGFRASITKLSRHGGHDWDAAGIGFFLQGYF